MCNTNTTLPCLTCAAETAAIRNDLATLDQLLLGRLQSENFRSVPRPGD